MSQVLEARYYGDLAKGDNMIEYIHTRCNAWVLWRRRKEDEGLGYPKCSAFTKTPGGGVAGFKQILGEPEWEIERAIWSMKTSHPKLFRAVTVFYLRTGTVEMKATWAGCCRETLFDRLHQAHNLIMAWLNDEAAGLHAHPMVQKRSCELPTVSV